MRWAAGTILFLALASPAPAAAPELLVRAAAARERAAYSGEQIVATWEGGRAHVAWVHVQHDPEVGTRLVYRTGAAGDRRRVVWQLPDRTVEYDAWSRTGRVYRPPPVRLSARSQLDRLLENYHVTTTSSQALGRPALRVRIRARYPGRPRADLRVDAQTGVILRSERVSADGRSREVAAFVNFARRPEGWMRAWRIPEDLHLQREPPLQPVTPEQVAVRFGRRLPQVLLPVGFVPATDYLLDPLRPAVRRLYSDGLVTLVLSARPDVSAAPPPGSRTLRTGDGPTWVQSAGIRHSVYWSGQGWAFALTAELTPEVLVRVARSTGIRPPSPLERLLDWLQRTVAPDSDT